MLLVSSPSNFLLCGGSSYCCKSDALAKNSKNKQSNSSDIYNEIVHYSFPFINYFQGIFTCFFKSSPTPQKNFPQSLGKSVDHYNGHKHFVGQRCVMSPETRFARLIFVRNHYFVRVRPHRNKIAKQVSFVTDGSEVALFNKLF